MLRRKSSYDIDCRSVVSSPRPDRRLRTSTTDAENPEEIEALFNTGTSWNEFYGEVQEEDPAGTPKPLGNPVKINTYLDADHAGNAVTRRSQTFVNNALIVQCNKRLNSDNYHNIRESDAAGRSCEL